MTARMSGAAPTDRADHHHAAGPPAGEPRPPLAVDLDGTLTFADTLHEGVLDLLKRSPLHIVTAAQALWDGKAAVKQSVAAGAAFDPAILPYDPALLAYLRAEHAAGRRIGLFTAADQSIADAVAAHLGLFSVVRGSDGTTNLSGAAKAAAIEAAFGPGFAYAGDSMADMPVFARAATVILAGKVDRLRASLPPTSRIEAAFAHPPTSLAAWARALRLAHWAKNGLVFVAPVLAQQPSALAAALLLFVLFGAIASATYLLNDMTDLAADRAHPTKRARPLASGLLSVRQGVFAAAALIGGALLLSLLALPFGCTASLLAYLLMTLCYSAILKHIAMVDIAALGGLFTLRILAGNMLVDGPIAPWLLTFSMLFFLGLAAIKRYAELHRVGSAADGDGTARGYGQQDMPILLATGVASGVSAIVIFMIYLINEQYPNSAYGHPDALWGIMPVLLVWTLRLWHLAVHGRMDEDPVVFALSDRVSWVLGAAIMLLMVVARL